MKPSSRRRRETAIGQLKPYFQKPVRNINRTDVERWAPARATGTSARTFNIERETLIQALDYAKANGLLLDNPARIVKRRKEPKAKPIIPTREQFGKLVVTIRALDARAEDSANLVECLGYSGMRLGEAVCMQWGDINSDLKNFTVFGSDEDRAKAAAAVDTKNMEARTVPLFPALDRLFRRMRAELPKQPSASDRLFGIRDGKKAIDTACRKAELPHFTHHSLRHFFCSNAIEEGVDFKTIAGWLGHNDGGILVARTYGHLRDTHSQTMAQRMTFRIAAHGD